MGRSFKVRYVIFAVLGVLGWATLGATAAIVFEREVTVPHCHDVCRTAGDELEHYRAYTKRNPREACVCRSGREIRPSLLRNPTGFLLTAFVALPMLSLFAWSNVVDTRTARKRAAQPPVTPKHRRR